MALATASVAAAGPTLQIAALSSIAAPSSRALAVPVSDSGLPAVYEFGTEVKVRRMKAEVTKPKISWP